MPAHLIHGDSFLVSQQLKLLTAEAGADAILEANRHQLAGGQLNLAELLAVCNALPFMDDCRLVLVTGLLATQESRGGRGRGSRSLGEWDKLADAIPLMPETTLLIFVDDALSDSNPLLRSLQPVTLVQRLQAPTAENLARYVREMARQKGSGISPAAIKTLTDLVGNDLWTLDREMEKLSLYATGRNIEEQDIQELVAQVREASIFNAVDAMIDGRPDVALRLLQRLRQDGAALPYIISMVERQLRLVCLARYWTEQRVSPQELAGKLGVPPFVARKTAEQARRNSWPDLDRRYQRLLEADLAFKTGRVDSEDLALEMLVVDLASPASGSGNRPPARGRRP